MQNETARYRLSVYQTLEVIRETPDCRIEKVLCTLDDSVYIKRTYPDDKRALFHALSRQENARIPQIKEIIFDANTTVIERYIQGKSLSEVVKSDRITVFNEASKRHTVVLTFVFRMIYCSHRAWMVGNMAKKNSAC